MQITKNKVVGIDYTLSDDEGQLIDSSSESEPLYYLHGVGNIIAGLENELEGKSVGDHLKFSVPPEDAYGEHLEDLIQIVSRDSFGSQEDLEVGMQFEIPDEDDEDSGLVFTITDIDGEDIYVDGNHELAGLTLHFEVTINEVRDATEEELEHGHAHYPGDDHHH